MDNVPETQPSLLSVGIGADELATMVLPDEPGEHAYRRGYRDGFIEAVVYLQDRPKGISNEQLLDILYSHWEVPLALWQRRASETGFDMPPRVEIPGNAYRRRIGELQRRAVIDAAAFRCFYCGREERSYNVGPDAKPWHIDHHTALARGGTHEPSNFVLACERCNLHKHTSTW